MPRLIWRVAHHVLVAAVLLIAIQRMGLVKRQVVHVAVEGNDWNSGTSDAPLRTIQAGLNRVAPGGEVVVHDGTYWERIHVRQSGLEQRRTTLRAEDPGGVLVSWFSKPVDFTDAKWRREGRFWRREVDWPVHVVKVEERYCYHARFGVRSLEELTARPGAQAAFSYANGELVLFVPDETPEETAIQWNREVPDPREWGEHQSANVWIEANHVAIEGIEFQCGVGAGVRIWNGRDVSIKDCAFSGAALGVDAAHGNVPSEQLAVERCLYHNYPQHKWLRGWLPWADIYANYDKSSLVKAVDEGTTIRDCVVTHFGDGMQLSSRTGQPADVSVKHNWLACGTDDAFEIEGPAAGVTVTGNLVVDCHESLGLSPVTHGPVKIEQNCFAHPRMTLNGAQLKFVPPERRAHEVIRNILVRENVFVGNWGCWYAPDVQCESIIVHSNQFFAARWNDPRFPTGVEERDNEFVSIDPTQEVLSSEGLTELVGDELREHFSRVVGPSWWNWEERVETRELNALRKEILKQAP
ncbi:MAG: right-handed parallel beta-helix repeat-containing protein [Planctomycetaceae bacterium]|nr:right-handed parallel beta-helix repeat-containing protein [Planctomycetaceae bacterium]